MYVTDARIIKVSNLKLFEIAYLSLDHTAVKRGAPRAQFPPKLSLDEVLNFQKFPLLSPKVKTVAEKLSFVLRI